VAVYQPGKPELNAVAERLNACLRDELLNETLLCYLGEARPANWLDGHVEGFQRRRQ
jgi:hypothetical protein